MIRFFRLWLSTITRLNNRRHHLLSTYIQVISTSVVLTGLVLGIRQTSILQPLELAVFDQLVRWSHAPEPEPRLLLVEITESDIQTQKHWPLSDQVIAKVLKTLQQNQPRVIGIDIYRDIPQEPGHTEFVKQLEASNIVGIEKLGGAPAPPSVPRERVGFNDLLIDPDGVVRRILLFATDGDVRYYSFGLRLSLAYLDERLNPFRVKPDSLEIGDAIFPALKPTSGGYQNADAAGYQVILRYHSPKAVMRRVSLTQILNGEFKPEWVRDKVVLIGITAPSANNLF